MLKMDFGILQIIKRFFFQGFSLDCANTDKVYHGKVFYEKTTLFNY